MQLGYTHSANVNAAQRTQSTQEPQQSTAAAAAGGGERVCLSRRHAISDQIRSGARLQIVYLDGRYATRAECNLLCTAVLRIASLSASHRIAAHRLRILMCTRARTNCTLLSSVSSCTHSYKWDSRGTCDPITECRLHASCIISNLRTVRVVNMYAH